MSKSTVFHNKIPKLPFLVDGQKDMNEEAGFAPHRIFISHVRHSLTQDLISYIL